MYTRHLSAAVPAAALLAAFAVGPALAQTPPNAATAPAASGATAPAAGNGSAADFVRQAANSDMFEVRSSQIALDKTQDPQIRSFAQRMVHDHTQADDRLKAAAKGQTVPTSPDAEHARMLQQLQGLSGNGFTQAYLQMQSAGHRQAVDLFQAYARNGSDPGLKQYAEQTLPTLHEHQQLLAGIPGAPSGQHARNGAPQFLTQEAPGLWRSSELIGLTVYNGSNENVGDINDVLVDRNGNAQAVVIGVGGFLGIGERDVAVPFNALQWSMQPAPVSGTGTGAATTNATGAGGTIAPGAPGAPGTVPGNAATSGTAANANRAYPDHAVLPDASRDELRNAPEFRYAGAR